MSARGGGRAPAPAPRQLRTLCPSTCPRCFLARGGSCTPCRAAVTSPPKRPAQLSRLLPGPQSSESHLPAARGPRVISSFLLQLSHSWL